MQWHTPMGYKVENGKIIIHREHEKIIKRIFRDYDNGISALKIATILKEQGIKNVHGRLTWTHAAIGRILENQNYLGTEYYPQLIDKELFERVQEKREQTRKNKNCGRYRPDKKERILFGGVLVCGACGEPYSHIQPHRKTSSEEAKWKCRHYVYHNRLACAGGFITDREVKEVCIHAVNKLLQNPQEIMKAQEPAKRFSEEYHRINQEIETYRRGITQDITELLYQRAQERYKTLDVCDITERTKEMQRILAGRTEIHTFDEELYKNLIEKIIVYKDYTVKVVFHNKTSLRLGYGNGEGSQKGEVNGSKAGQKSVHDSSQSAV